MQPGSLEEAEASATEWLGPSPSLMRTWLVSAIMDRGQHRDIGKALANVVEGYVNEWLSQQSGRPVKTIVGKSWDGITDDDKPAVRNQIKFRMDAWHFETTIRCVPVSALINPAKPDQLISGIPAAIRKIYDNEAKTLEVIAALYHTCQTPL